MVIGKKRRRCAKIDADNMKIMIEKFTIEMLMITISLG